MQLIVDEQSDVVLDSNPGTLAELLLAVTEFLQTRGRVLLGIVLDGESIPPESLTPGLGQYLVSNIERLEITSASAQDLVLETLDEVSEVIAELPTVCHEIAQTLASESPESCFGYFNQLLDLWEVLHDRQAQVINQLGVDAGSLQAGEVSVAEHRGQVVAQWAAARKMMESSSFAQLSDLFSHEIVGLAAREADVIEALRTVAKT